MTRRCSRKKLSEELLVKLLEVGQETQTLLA
jgi:hypothetical protein